MMPIKPHFVLDGPNRPSTKRGKHVRGDDDWCVEPFKQILDIYGFQYSTVSISALPNNYGF
jgi:holliday junction resolvase YEN1